LRCGRPFSAKTNKLLWLPALLGGLLVWISCQTAPVKEFDLYTPQTCGDIRGSVNRDDSIKFLNTISVFFKNNCFKDVIRDVEIAKANLKDKTFSLIGETVELFIPEGSVTKYVLESYERGYLSFLSAVSYAKLGGNAEVFPELNKIYNEETALTYNHGRDPVNSILQAAMWDNFQMKGFSSRPFWQWLARDKSLDQVTKDFALEQIRKIDANPQKYASETKWQIYASELFPPVDWHMNIVDSKHGYFEISPLRKFPKACASGGGLLFPTTSWFDKLSRRHAYSYHPLVNVKSWIRAPFGLTYGISVFATGAAITVGGCSAVFSAREGATLCGYSIMYGVAVMQHGSEFAKNTLKPDLRHWELVPAAFYIHPVPTGSDAQSKPANSCLDGVEPYDLYRVL